MDIVRGLIGVAFLIFLAYVFSDHRRYINWKVIATGLAIQLTMAILVLKVPFFYDIINWIGGVFVTVINFSNAGAKFIFGDLTNPNQFGFIFAVRVLPTIIFFSALTSGLYYLGILQKVVFFIAYGVKKLLKLTGAESLSAAGNIFLGQTEAPLLIKHYLAKMNRSQLFCIMVGGMATLAGSVLASYIEFLGGSDPVAKKQYALHFLTASLMNAPAAIIMSKMLVPETEQSLIDEKLELSDDKVGRNLIDALSIGAIDGLKLAAIITGMLIAFISVIFLVNYLLTDIIGFYFNLNSWVVEITQGQFKSFNLQFIFGQVFRPIAYIIGVDWKDTLLVGALLGEKTVINEFIAYKTLSDLEVGAISEKSKLISVYALCGFSNFSSIAIQVGGLGSIAPDQRPVLSELGLRAVLGGTLACLLSATLAGMLV
jgi:concentrative nucleoside transporter, CNT family